MNRMTVGKMRRDQTRKRRANARALGLCTVCMTNEATLALGRTTGTPSTCVSCRDRKRAKRAAKA